MFVNERFELGWHYKQHFKRRPNPFSKFGQFIFYRTYSRNVNGYQETWADVVIRVIEGVFSIRKDYYTKNKIYWSDNDNQAFARQMAESLFNLKWSPPGRGLWAMGTNYIYESGSLGLYNCAYVDLYTGTTPIDRENFASSIAWIMDALMNGVGVGFSATKEDNAVPLIKRSTDPYKQIYQIPDSREGWCESVRRLINSYTLGYKQIDFDYSLIRARGLPIKRFGGVASGPEPLKLLHQQIRECFNQYGDNDYSLVQLKADLANLVGCCVVSGNVRRSAEIAVGDVNDSDFINLKNYTVNPSRAGHGWMSNNSVRLAYTDDFNNLPKIADLIREKGEPGFINQKNFQFGRLGKYDDRERFGIREDEATGINPCGEIPLESYEVCNLAEVFPTRCDTELEYLQACNFATFYCSTVSLLPTHFNETNKVVNRNRRIGIGLVDVSGWKQSIGLSGVTRLMRQGYAHIREVNKNLANEAGVPASIRVTTIKPGGTVAKIGDRTSGIGYPNFKYMIRRIRLADNIPIISILKKAGVPLEEDKCSKGTLVAEFPLRQYGNAKEASRASMWEQMMNIIHAQREWSDNAVSNTIMFKEEERDDIESLLSFAAPNVKSISMLPISTDAYEQMPEERISEEEYEKRVNSIKDIDWSKYNGSDGIDEKYCSGDVCEVKRL